MHSVFESPKARQAEHDSIEAQVAAFIRNGGSITQLPPASFAREHQPFSINQNGKTMHNPARQQWKEGV